MTDDRDTAQALSACGAPQGVADAHGMLCALLCCDPGLPASAWLESLGATPRPELAEPLRELFRQTRDQLGPERFDLQLQLPDDAEPLALRVAALAEWCQGFLGGLGLGGVDPDRLGGAAAEFVHDLAGIALVAHDGNDDDEAEGDYVELLEYLRAGTYLVRDALQPGATARTPS
jgi:hypothetical protein